MAEVTDSHQYRFGPVGAFVAGREVSTFFALTLALSWAVWLPGAVGIADLGPLTLLLGGFGPLAAAAIVTWLVGDSLRAWAGQVLRWRVRPRWYLAAFGIPLAIIAAMSLVYATFGTVIDLSVVVSQAPIYALSLVIAFLLNGGQEELGWRGFALPRLLERFDAVTASLVIGVVWALWHLPLAMMAGSRQFVGFFIASSINLFALSILLTWLYRNTGRSVLLAMILHASANSVSILIAGQIATDTPPWLLAAVTWTLALGLVVMYGRDLRSGGTDDRETVEEHTPPVA
jgi:membrane protease YdiL (CAAX protease family)